MSVNRPENDYRDYLEHSAEGTKWGNHKYLYIKNGRYYYPSDVAKTAATNANRRIYRKTGINVGGALGSVGSRVSSVARNTANRLRPRNVNRAVYRKTGVNVGGAVSSAGSRVSSAARNTATRLKPRNINRSIYRKTGVNVGGAVSSARSRAKAIADSLRRGVNTARSRQILATTRAKGSVRNAVRNVGSGINTLRSKQILATTRAKNKARNAASNVSTRLQPKNVGRAIYKKTGVNVSGAVSSARNRIGGAINNLLEKRKKNKKK